MTSESRFRSRLEHPGESRLLAEQVLRKDRIDETDWLEWKSTVDLSAKKWHFEISRQILGMSNRMPDTASRNHHGLGYILFGMKPGVVTGVERLDPAILEDAINSYLGSTGPDWDYEYVDLDGKLVLVAIVSAPRPGDPIHTLRKGYEGFGRGAIFVRKTGKTEQADPDDIHNLQHRVSGARLILRFSLVGDLPIPWFDELLLGARIERIARLKRELILNRAQSIADSSRVARPSRTISQAWQQSVLGTEERSLEEYSSEVAEWHDTWVERARAHWLGKYFESGYGVYSMLVENRTERNFSSVEVRITINGVEVLTETDQRDVGLPRPPRAYGSPRWMGDLQNFVDFGFPVADLYHGYSPPTVFAEYEDHKSYVVWDAGDIRPKQMIQSADIYLAIGSNDLRGKLTGRWSATATSADGVVEDDLDHPLSEVAIGFDEFKHEFDTTVT